MFERFRSSKPQLFEQFENERLLDELARLPIQAPDYHLDRVLLDFADGSTWTLADLFQHTHVYGQPGSGKSSGSLATLYRLCARDMGMLCLTAKEDEPGRLITMALEAGRPEQSIIVIDDQLKWRFNFLDYEMKRRGGGDTRTIVETLLTMAEASDRQEGGGSGDEAFWRKASREMLTHCINVLKLSQDTLRLADIHRYLSSMPRSPEQLNDGAFMDNSFAALQTVQAMVREEEEGLGRGAAMAMDYLKQNAFGDQRTTGNILVTITSTLQPFLGSGVLHELFCTETNWTPELVMEKGALTILAFPALLYKHLGIMAQVIFKAAFAQACAARPDNPQALPVVLYADEAQLFYTDDDNRLAEIGRGKRVAMIYGTQNIGNYIRALGGANAEAKTKSLLGNFSTHIFHANGHAETNEHATRMIGRRLQIRESVSTTVGVSSGRSGCKSWGRSVGRSLGQTLSRTFGRSGGKSKSKSRGHNVGGSSGFSRSADSPYPGQGTYNYSSSGGRNSSVSTSENDGWSTSTNEGQNVGSNESENVGGNEGWNEGTNESQGHSANQVMDNDLEAAVFVSQLRTGGKRHDFAVDAIVVQAGRQWKNGRNWTLASFKQE